MVGVLILIDMDVLVALLVIGQDLWIFVKEPKSHHDQIIKVHGLRLPQFLLVGLVASGHNFRVEITSLHFVGHFVNQVVLGIGNGA